MEKSRLETYRDFLKDSVRKAIDFRTTDQNMRIPPPPIEKPFDPDAKRIDLVPPEAWEGIGNIDLCKAIGNRKSRRQYADKPLTIEELSFLLWATQGIRQRIGGILALRTVPSAGARHALETYLCALRVEGLEVGFYRYLPVEHQLVLEFAEPRAADEIVAASFGQHFLGEAAVSFIWTTIPYRMEWRYDIAAHKVIALDAGHVCQNLYLACEAIGAGTCAIAAYDQEAMDRLLRIDGVEEYAIYLAPVGKINA